MGSAPGSSEQPHKATAKVSLFFARSLHAPTSACVASALGRPVPAAAGRQVGRGRQLPAAVSPHAWARCPAAVQVQEYAATRHHAGCAATVADRRRPQAAASAAADTPLPARLSARIHALHHERPTPQRSASSKCGPHHHALPFPAYCQPGSYYDPNAALCQSCPKGTYSTVTWRFLPDSCTPCPRWTTTNVTQGAKGPEYCNGAFVATQTPLHAAAGPGSRRLLSANSFSAAFRQFYGPPCSLLHAPPANAACRPGGGARPTARSSHTCLRAGGGPGMQQPPHAVINTSLFRSATAHSLTKTQSASPLHTRTCSVRPRGDCILFLP